MGKINVEQEVKRSFQEIMELEKDEEKEAKKQNRRANEREMEMRMRDAMEQEKRRMNVVIMRVQETAEDHDKDEVGLLMACSRRLGLDWK